MKREPSELEQEKIATAIFSGDRVEAINLYMSITGCGLTEAQDSVMATTNALREASPERFKGNNPKQTLFGRYRAS